MTRHFGIPSTPAEQVARDAAAYLPVAERETDPLSAAKGIFIGLLLMLPIWSAMLAAWWFL